MNQAYLLVVLSLLAVYSLPTRAEFSANVMAPLTIGDVYHPQAPSSQPDWDAFRQQLIQMKHLGVEAVSTDVWWGVIESERDGHFDWSYYDRLSNEIISAHLRWVPILSFHRCGGNVGDRCDIPLPDWIWQKYVGQKNIQSPEDLKYLSEDGHSSSEVISVWATPVVLQDYIRVMKAFQEHFKDQAPHIAEINISLGAAGELRYPSYNAHDPGAGYPSRGRLQSYSRLARQSFARFMKARHGDQAQTDPPHRGAVPEAEEFFRQGQIHSRFGQDFFDWYSDSLLAHGRLVLTAAIAVFDNENSPFKGIDIGAKVPGVHWRMAFDRSAELAAGLVRTSEDLNNDAQGHGYHEIIRLFHDLQSVAHAPRLVMHFTCLEMDNGEGGPEVGSLAQNLVFWVAQEAYRQNVPIKGENALADAMASQHKWDNLINAVNWAGYLGLTLLRMGDVAASPLAQSRLSDLTQRH